MDDRRSCADDTTSSAVNRKFGQRFDNGFNFSASSQNKFCRSNRPASGGGFSNRAYRGNNNSKSPGSRVSTVHFEMAMYHLFRITQRTPSQVKIKTRKIFLFGEHFSLFRKNSNLLTELKTFKILVSITILHRRHALSVALPQEAI